MTPEFPHFVRRPLEEIISKNVEAFRGFPFFFNLPKVKWR